MDINLLFRIFIAQFGVVLVVAIIAQLIAPGGIDLIFWTVFTLIFTGLAYRRQKKTADDLGITQDHKDYQQTRFTTVVDSSLSPDDIIQSIQESPDYVGRVTLDDQEISKQRWKGVANMSKSQITKIDGAKGGHRYDIQTQPYWKYTLVDGYANYKAHQVLTDLIG